VFRALCLLLCLSSPSFAQTLRSSSQGWAPTSPVEVFYVVDDSTLTTYNIDQETFEASAVGTTTMPASKYPGIVTSPDGQFLYYLTDSSFAGTGQKLYAYETNAAGVPEDTPVQAMNAGQLAGLVMNRGGTFLYSIAVGPIGQQYTRQYSIVRNVIDLSTGKLSQPVSEATYQLDSNASGNDCSLSILGFNPAGTIMYDGIFCGGPHASGSSTYNQRTVDLQTGALGPDQQVYGFGYYAGSGYANVQFENNFMFAFDSYENQGPNENIVDVFQMPNVSAPAVNCTATMLAACGDFGHALAHPSGEYVFLESNGTQIGQVNLETQQIVEVNSLPFTAWMFSPDGGVAYGQTSTGSPHDVYIAGFNAANGEVKLGGTIQLPHVLDYWIAAKRD
jgi:hypothetical protein